MSIWITAFFESRFFLDQGFIWVRAFFGPCQFFGSRSLDQDSLFLTRLSLFPRFWMGLFLDKGKLWIQRNFGSGQTLDQD